MLARHWPPRFDVAAESRFPPARPGRLAHQIRQDLWRELQGLRGFSPVIQIDADERGLTVTAGGRLEAASLPHDLARARIAALLECPRHRARWLAWAQERTT
ncbi:hypothetical protein KB874_13960 [Aestuariicoccus sp. KMU-90]|uniref:Uncharacterized protein n=1 Tax=Thetidibacter halocola TaxID=2827239 RepID=A0A8J8B869_9RHOB|nr:hypothetical protein [Thetidibacter halocola]